jgi:endonuclease/exonuclease/phosphatase family metal-dependent hydrolase
MANKNNIKNLKKKTKKQRGGNSSPAKRTLNTDAANFNPLKSTTENISQLPVTFNAKTPAFKPLPKLIKIGTYNILFPGIVEKVFYQDKIRLVTKSSPVGFNYKSTQANTQANAQANELHEEIYENSEERTQIMINNLLIADLDIVCLQEVSNVVYFGKTSSVYDNIITNSNLIGQYNFSNLQIHPTRAGVGHGVMILYKKKFKFISDEFVKIPNYKNTTNRNCSIVSLQYNTKKICVVSCHFYDSRDYKQDDKTIQMNYVLAAINENKCDLNIIAGDFNQDQYGDLNVEGARAPIAPIAPIAPSEPLGPKKASVFKPLLSPDTENITQLYTFDDDLLPSEYTKNIDSETPSTYNTTIIPKTNKYRVTRRIDWIFCNDKNGQVPNTISLHNFDFRASDHSLKAVSINL